jgi:hypothetical protein
MSTAVRADTKRHVHTLHVFVNDAEVSMQAESVRCRCYRFKEQLRGLVETALPSQTYRGVIQIRDLSRKSALFIEYCSGRQSLGRGNAGICCSIPEMSWEL